MFFISQFNMNINIQQIFVFKRLFTCYLKLTWVTCVLLNTSDLKPQSYTHTHTHCKSYAAIPCLIYYLHYPFFIISVTRKKEIDLELLRKLLRADSSVRHSSLLSMYELQIAESKRSTLLNLILNKTPTCKSKGKETYFLNDYVFSSLPASSLPSCNEMLVLPEMGRGRGQV